MKFFKKYWIFIVAVFAVFMFIEQAVCLLILGSLFLFFSISGVLFLIKLEKWGLESRGIILEYQSDRKGYKTPIIEFQTAKNERIKEKPFVSTSLSGLENINKPVIVRYNRNKPEQFIIKDTIGDNFFVLVLIGIVAIGINVLSVLEFFQVTNLF